MMTGSLPGTASLLRQEDRTEIEEATSIRQEGYACGRCSRDKCSYLH